MPPSGSGLPTHYCPEGERVPTTISQAPGSIREADLLREATLSAYQHSLHDLFRPHPKPPGSLSPKSLPPESECPWRLSGARQRPSLPQACSHFGRQPARAFLFWTPAPPCGACALRRLGPMPRPKVEVVPSSQKKELKPQVGHHWNPFRKRPHPAIINVMGPIIEHKHSPVRQAPREKRQAFRGQLLDIAIDSGVSHVAKGESLEPLQALGETPPRSA
jgi:hypothetical protein